MSIAQHTFTTFDDPKTRRGGWQIKESAGLDDSQRQEEEQFLSSEVRLSPLEEVPLSISPEQRHMLDTRFRMSHTIDGRPRLSQERPAGIDGSGRPNNTFTHTVIQDTQQWMNDLGIPIQAYGAPWWLSPFGPREVTESSLRPDIELYPVPLAYDWRKLVSNRTLPAILDALDETVQARHQTQSRRLVVVEYSSGDYPEQWLAAIEHLCLPGNAWDLNFSTFERNLNPQRVTELLGAGFDIVFTPDRSQLGDTAQVFPLWDSSFVLPAAASEVSWGSLLVNLLMSVEESELWTLLGSLEHLVGINSTSLSPRPAWGLGILIYQQQLDPDQNQNLEDLIVFNPVNFLDPQCPAAKVYEDCKKTIMYSSDDIVDTASRLALQMDGQIEAQASIFQTLIDSLWRNPTKLQDLAPFTKLRGMTPELVAKLQFPSSADIVSWQYPQQILTLVFMQQVTPDFTGYPRAVAHCQGIAQWVIKLGTERIDEESFRLFSLLKDVALQKVATEIIKQHQSQPTTVIPAYNPSVAMRLARFHPSFYNDFLISLTTGRYAANGAASDLATFRKQAQDSTLQKQALELTYQFTNLGLSRQLRGEILGQVTDISWLKPYARQLTDSADALAPKIFALTNRQEIREWGQNFLPAAVSTPTPRHPSAAIPINPQVATVNPCAEIMAFDVTHMNMQPLIALNYLRQFLAETSRLQSCSPALFADAVALINIIAYREVDNDTQDVVEPEAMSSLVSIAVQTLRAYRNEEPLFDTLQATGLWDEGDFLWLPKIRYVSVISALSIAAQDQNEHQSFHPCVAKWMLDWCQYFGDLNSQIIAHVFARSNRSYQKQIKDMISQWLQYFYNQVPGTKDSELDARIRAYLDTYRTGMFDKLKSMMEKE